MKTPICLLALLPMSCANLISSNYSKVLTPVANLTAIVACNSKMDAPSMFICAKYYPAKLASQQTGIPILTLLTQAALESGWGESAPNNNYFGHKGSGAEYKTRECDSSNCVETNAEFKKYPSDTAAFIYHAKLLKSKRYSPTLKYTDTKQYFKSLADSGYASDPNYGESAYDVSKSVAYRLTQIINGENK